MQILFNSVEKQDYEAIAAYNIGLWMLVQLVKRHIELTLLASDVFKEKKQTFLKDRQAKIEEKQKILEDRTKALE